MLFFSFTRQCEARFCRSRAKKSQCRVNYARLEPRRLLAGVSLNPANGELTIFGDSENNVARIDLVDAATFRVNLSGAANQDFPVDDVEKLIFIGFGGDDQFTNGTALTSLILGNDGNDTLRGGTGFDTINGGNGHDEIRGSAGNDRLIGANGDDQIWGGLGDDSIVGGSGANNLRGEGGNDIIFGGDDAEMIFGGSGIDQIFALGGNDTIFSGTGGVAGTPGVGQADLVLGLDGDDTITGSTGLDVFWGGNGNDTLIGGNGENRLHGQNGNDMIRGGAFADYLAGNNQDDLIFGGGGADFILGGAGQDRLFGEGNNDTIEGGIGDDQLLGGAGQDILSGGADRDSLYGGPGNDRLMGESGDDGLFAGIGSNELLRGGPGNDRFLIYGNDSIADFAAGDAQVVFLNATDNWTDKEVETVDVGLRELHHRTESTTLLKDSLDPQPIRFFKHVREEFGAGTGGKNELFWQGSWREDGSIISQSYDRRIRITDWNEANPLENENAALAVIHEISHSWDSVFEIKQAAAGAASVWTTFLSRSGWENSNPGPGHRLAPGQTLEPFDRVFSTATGQYQFITRSWWHDNDAKFARNYGGVSAKEDWGTVWESLFVESIVENPNGSHATKITNKVALVDFLFDAI